VSQSASLFHSPVPIFLDSRNGKVVNIDGQTLSIAAVVAAARCQAAVQLDDSPHIKERLHKSRAVIASKVSNGASVYGLSTGFGGSGESFGILCDSLSYARFSGHENGPTLVIGTRSSATPAYWCASYVHRTSPGPTTPRCEQHKYA